MNTPKIDCHELILQNQGRICDLACHPPQYFGDQQNLNMGICAQPHTMEAGSHLQQHYLLPEKSSSSILSRFESPALAFYATERYMGLPYYGCHAGSDPSLCSQSSKSCDSQIPSYPSSVGSYSVDSEEQADHNFEWRSNTKSTVKPHFRSNQDYKSLEKSYTDLCCSSSGNRLHHYDQNTLLAKDAGSGIGHFSVPFQENRDHRVGCSPYSSLFAQPALSPQHQKHSPRFSTGVVSLSSANHASTGPALSSKTRIRWTLDLHEKFVECVNRLGGADKATPKAILKLMDSDGLTIVHVKSHLQKYRIAKYMPDSSEGKAEKRSSLSEVPLLDVKTGLQIREALQLQLDVQRHLHEQLEIQRSLQLRIEEQSKQLRMMFDQQQRTNNSLQNSRNSDIASPEEPTFSLEDIDVSIADDSNSNNNTLFPSKIS